MMKKLFTALFLFASVVKAQEPSWIYVCTSFDGSRYSISLNRSEGLGTGKVRALVQKENKQTAHTFWEDIDCESWSSNGEIMAKGTVGEARIKYICKQDNLRHRLELAKQKSSWRDAKPIAADGGYNFDWENP